MQLFIGFYVTWYCCECIRDSASGGLRAIDAFSGGLDIWEEFFQYIKVMATCILFTSPVIFYIVYCIFNDTRPNQAIVISLLGYSAFFFPMALLAMVLFDSLSALNPWLLVRSIISTFPQYIGLVAIFYGLGAAYYYAVFRAMFNIMPQGEAAVMQVEADPAEMFANLMLFRLVSEMAFMWLALVLCHLLGRFFYRYDKKLYWEV